MWRLCRLVRTLFFWKSVLAAVWRSAGGSGQWRDLCSAAFPLMIALASSYFDFVFRWYCTTYLCWYESLHRPINLISREREVLPAFVIVWYWSTYLDTWYCSAYLDTLPEGCLVLWQSWPQEEFKSVAILTTGQWWWLHNRIHFSIYIIHKPGCAIDNIKCNLKLTDLFHIGKSYIYIFPSHIFWNLYCSQSDRFR